MGINVKVLIEVFESAVGRLRVEEVDDRNEHEVEGSENDIEAVCKVLDSGWGKLSADKSKKLSSLDLVFQSIVDLDLPNS